MRNQVSRNIIVAISLTWPLANIYAQQESSSAAITSTGRVPAAATAPTSVPALVPYSGAALDSKGHPLTGEASATFLIYKDQQGGEPLFTESQVVTFDEAGHYKVQMGAANPNGLPSDLFSSGEARWLEVQVAGEATQPRVLLASVPYALKAADAATLGGLPPSAFALARPASETAAAFSPAITPNVTSNVTTTGGTVGYVPEFSGTSSVVDSPIFVTTTGEVGIGTTTPAATLDVSGTTFLSGLLIANGGATLVGPLELAPVGTATAATGYNSQYLKIFSSAYNSTSKTVVNPRFEWEAEATGNNTAAPGATLNLLSSTTASNAAETGFYLNSNGTIHFAPGQTFPGTGAGTITGVTAGTGLTGGGTSGNVTLNVNAATISTLAGNNTFTGSNVFVPSIYADLDVNIDNTNANNGNNSPGLRFGSASGEGIASKRTSGGNQYGLDFYTDYAARIHISATGQVGINTTPITGSQLAVVGTGDGVYGTTTDNTATDDVAGVHGFSNTVLPGVEGRNYTSGSGYAAEANGPGVLGLAGQFYSEIGSTGPFAAGVYGSSYRYDGVFGESNLAAGVVGEGVSTGTYGFSSTGYGIYGDDGNYANESPNALAGYFNGSVQVIGTLTASAKDFKIDHPSDPANKYLVHASVESSEMMNIYSGNVTTDELGLATVTLPSWFEDENGDFRYQLTIIGRKAQAWISQEVKDGKFQISSDATHVKVSWQITAVRQDAFAKAHPLIAEQEKPEKERGFYMHPELYGQPEQKQTEWARHPEFKAAQKAKRDATKSRGPEAKPSQIARLPATQEVTH
jgi:trimeric autotransporter adhesin